MHEYVAQELAYLVGSTHKPVDEPVDVVLYGFGRIGRLMALILIAKTDGGDSLRLRAVVVRRGKAEDDLLKRASLLRRDSVHGVFQGTIRVDEERQSFVANGNEIKVIYADAPEDIDYTQHGIKNCVVVDNTGVWRDEAGLSRHLKAKGVAKVILTAPGKGDIKNIVAGINDGDIQPEDEFSPRRRAPLMLLCRFLRRRMTTTALVQGVETVHAYTNDQNLIDNYHTGERRGRSAPLNMVLTETGAAKAVAKVLPGLSGKLTGNAIRVPTPNVSMAILNLNLAKSTTREELNEFMRETALHSTMKKQIDDSTPPKWFPAILWVPGRPAYLMLKRPL